MSDNYWSATTYAYPDNQNNAWIVNFDDGEVNNDNKDDTNLVRCVRALPPPAPGLLYAFMTTIFTLEKLYRAYNECKKGKRNTANALIFEFDREKNLLALLDDLRSGRYRISRHICFIATESTPREIFAADFRDRIVHHLLYNELYGIFDAGFIPYSYANRVKKGTHAAVKQLRKNIQEVKRRSGGGWYLKLDVQSFFRSIDKDILYSLIERRFQARAEDTGGGSTSRKSSGCAKKSSFMIRLGISYIRAIRICAGSFPRANRFSIRMASDCPSATSPASFLPMCT